MKPQDILVLTKIVVSQAPAKTFQAFIAQSLSLSQAEVSFSLKRSCISGLYDPEERKVNKTNLLELLVHAVKYFFPATPGALTRGTPTAWTASPLNKIIHDEGTPVVWPDAEGAVRGHAVTPLYKSVPYAARNDKDLHSALALIDALRFGRARERKLAVEELKKILA